MRTATVCFLLRGEEILLARKKRKDGVGLWNGYGGDVRMHETVPNAAVRELREECEVEVQKEHLIQRALIKTYLWLRPYFTVHAFITHQWLGTPKESQEMGEPRWFPFSKIPYAEMFPDDHFWLPRILSGENLDAHVFFSYNGKKVHKIHFSKPSFI